MRVPHDEDGKFFEEAKLAISISVSNSCPPYSCEGNAKIANSSVEYCFPNFSNNAYPFAVNPHCDATFCANTTFPSKSDVDKVDPSDLIPVNE